MNILTRFIWGKLFEKDFHNYKKSFNDLVKDHEELLHKYHELEVKHEKFVMEADDIRRADHVTLRDMKETIRVLRATLRDTSVKLEWERRAELKFVINKIKAFLGSRLNKDVHPSVFWKWLYEMEGLVSDISNNYYKEEFKREQAEQALRLAKEEARLQRILSSSKL